MATITNHGRLQCRTPLLTREEAEAKRDELASRPAFRDVAVVESARAKGERAFYVEWVPASEELCAALLAGQQHQRDQRAKEQTFTFALDESPRGPVFWCFSHGSGNTYRISGDGCECPDAVFRAHSCQLSCKHEVALKVAVEQGSVIGYECIGAARAA